MKMLFFSKNQTICGYFPEDNVLGTRDSLHEDLNPPPVPMWGSLGQGLG